MTEWLIVLAVIIIAALFLVYQANKQPSFNPPPPKEIIQKDMTAAELRQYDGIKSKYIFLALKGIIYDVSGSEFYQVGGNYHVLAGHDASVNLGKMKEDEQFLDKYGQIELDGDQKAALDHWVSHFEMKYRKVGIVIVDSPVGGQS